MSLLLLCASSYCNAWSIWFLILSTHPKTALRCTSKSSSQYLFSGFLHTQKYRLKQLASGHACSSFLYLFPWAPNAIHKRLVHPTLVEVVVLRTDLEFTPDSLLEFAVWLPIQHACSAHVIPLCSLTHLLQTVGLNNRVLYVSIAVVQIQTLHLFPSPLGKTEFYNKAPTFVG